MRGVLKYSLYILAKLSIKKHKMKFIVVTGWYDTAMVRELLYTALSQYDNVRRNTEEVWWDMSVPLNILGYKDKQRSVIEWLRLFGRAIYVLLTNPRNPQCLIINIDTERTETASYWSRLLKPDIIIVLNRKLIDPLVEKLLDSGLRRGARIITDYDYLPQFQSEDAEITTYSTRIKEADFYYRKYKDMYQLTIRGKKISLPGSKWEQYPPHIWAAVLTAADLLGYDLNEVVIDLLKFDLETAVFDKIKHSLEYSLL